MLKLLHLFFVENMIFFLFFFFQDSLNRKFKRTPFISNVNLFLKDIIKVLLSLLIILMCPCLIKHTDPKLFLFFRICHQ